MAKALVSGYHHLTLSTYCAQEDYDFYTKTLGLYSVKRTVLFDGTIPVCHLYYGSRHGDASTVITTFPFKKPGVYGRRGTNQSRTIMQSIPVGASDYWVDRLNGKGVKATKGSGFGLTRVMFTHPCGIPHELVEKIPATPVRPSSIPPLAPPRRPQSGASMAAASRCSTLIAWTNSSSAAWA